MPVAEKDLTIHLQVETHDLTMSTPKGADFRWFAICLTAAFEQKGGYGWSEEQVKKYLFPWLWSVDKVKVAILKKTKENDKASVPDYHDVPLVDRPAGCDTHPIITSLELQEARTFLRGAENFSYGKGKVTADDHPWAGALRSAADYPDDLPQVLNVVRYFKLPTAQIPKEAVEVYAAPYVTLPKVAGLYSPQDLDRPTWSYLGGPADAPQTTAEVGGADLAHPAGGWIAPKEVVAGTNWLQHLPGVFADAMQPVRAFLGQYSQTPADDGIRNWVYGELSRLFRNAQIALRPDKKTFVDTVADGAGNLGDTKALKEAISAAVAAWSDADLKSAFQKAVWGDTPPKSVQTGHLAALFDLADLKLAGIILEAWRPAVPDKQHQVAIGKSLQATHGIGSLLRAAAAALHWNGLKQDHLAKRDALESYIVERLLAANPKPPHDLDKQKTSETVHNILDGAFREDTKVGFEGLRIRFADSTTDPDHQEEQWKASHRVLPLLRQTGAAGWTVPSASRFRVLVKEGGDQPYSPQVFPEKPAAIPVQLFAVDGMLQAMTDYRNQPWASPSPLQAMATQRTVKPGPGTAVGPDGTIRYEKGGVRLPRLVARSSYDVAVARIGVAGNLPHEIAEGEQPWRLRSDIPVALPEMKTGVPFTVGYPVGRARVSPASIPQGERPIRQTMALLAAKHEDDKNDHRVASLLFTAPAYKDAFSEKAWVYTFRLRPPAVPLEVWEAHQASLAQGTPARNAAVTIRVRTVEQGDKEDAAAAQAHQTVLNKVREMRPDSEWWREPGPNDVSVDDPRVIGYRISLGKLPDVDYLFQNEPASNDETHLVQRPAVKFTLTAGNAGEQANVALDPANREVKITVDSAQSLSELKISCLANGAHNAPGAALVLLEVARPFPNPEETLSTGLHDCLKAGPWSQARPEEIPLKLDWSGQTAKDIRAVADLIEGFDIQVQRYIWDGRPLEYPVDSKTGKWENGFRFRRQIELDYETVLTGLDGMYFGERDSADRRDEPRESTQFDHNTGATLAPWPAPRDPGAAYYRFAVRARNRYAPILKSGSTIDSRLSAGQAGEERWKRVVVPCRLRGKRNTPAVKLILPLTSAQKGQYSPNLLVILEENALDHPGIAGGMRARLAQAAVPKDLIGGNAPDWIYETGADPIQEPPVNAVPLPAGAGDLGVTLRGPVGYTFDSGAPGSRYVRTAYVIPVEEILSAAKFPTGPDHNYSWWFLKVALRHTVNPDALVNPTGNGSETELDSDWTVPVWTQVLPAGNRWLLKKENDNPKLFEIGSNDGGVTLLPGNNVGLRDVDGSPLDSVRQKLNNGLSFQTWLLITQPVEDMLGRPGQERFKDLVPIEGAKVAATDRVRLVGIQFRLDNKPLPQNLPELAGLMFPADWNDLGELVDARARIVQMSPPIRLTQQT